MVKELFGLEGDDGKVPPKDLQNPKGIRVYRVETRWGVGH
jgi:hypothetical protein